MRALEMSPDCSEGIAFLKKVLKPFQKNYDEALEAFEKYQYRVAFGKASEALQLLRGGKLATIPGNTVLNTSPNDAAILPGVAKLLGLRPEWLQSKQLIEMSKAAHLCSVHLCFVNSSVSGVLRAVQAKCLQQLGKFTRAVQFSKNALKLLRNDKGWAKWVVKCVEVQVERHLNDRAYAQALRVINDFEGSAVDDMDDKFHSKKRQIRIKMKEGKRPDYYRILSRCPTVRELLKARGETWKLCSDPDSPEDSANEKKVSRFSQAAQLKTAYRRRCLEMHPDKQEGRIRGFEDESGSVVPEHQKKLILERTQKHFNMIQEAHEILSDATKKRHYDDGCNKEEIEERGKMGFW